MKREQWQQCFATKKKTLSKDIYVVKNIDPSRVNMNYKQFFIHKAKVGVNISSFILYFIM